MNIFQQTIKHFPFLFGQQFCVLEMFTVTFHTDISHLAQLSPWFPGEFLRQSRQWWRHHWQGWGSTKGWQIPYDLRNSAPSQNDAWKASALSEMHTHTHSDTHIKKTYTLLSQRQVLFSSIQNGLEKLYVLSKTQQILTHTHTYNSLLQREVFCHSVQNGLEEQCLNYKKARHIQSSTTLRISSSYTQTGTAAAWAYAAVHQRFSTRSQIFSLTAVSLDYIQFCSVQMQMLQKAHSYALQVISHTFLECFLCCSFQSFVLQLYWLFLQY